MLQFVVIMLVAIVGTHLVLNMAVRDDDDVRRRDGDGGGWFGLFDGGWATATGATGAATERRSLNNSSGTPAPIRR